MLPYESAHTLNSIQEYREMKKYLKVSMLALASAVMLLSATGMQAKTLIPTQKQHQAKPVDNAALDFELVNETGYDIEHLYVSPNDEDSWNDSILDDTLEDGGSVHVSFHPEEIVDIWDLRVDWLMDEDAEEDEYVYWQNVDLTEISTITLHYDEETGKTWAVAE